MPYNAEIYLYANSSENISRRILSSNPNMTVEEAKHILTNDEEHKALMEEKYIKSHLTIYTNHDTMMQCYKKGMTIDEANIIIENLIMIYLFRIFIVFFDNFQAKYSQI